MVGRTCRCHYTTRSLSHIPTITQHFVRKLSKQHVLNEGLTIYRRLQSDDQDSVRLLTVQALIVIAKQLETSEIRDLLLGQLRSSVSDKSWRVRYMVANEFVKVCSACTWVSSFR